MTGTGNTASGYYALYIHRGGSNNIALGYKAGSNIEASNNIDIGSSGDYTDSGVIRIGTPRTQNAVLIAGIVSSQVTGSAVYVAPGGRLGVLASSERYKTAIAPMEKHSKKLEQLRPVTFHLKSEPQGPVQYGLIAEEVDKIYPELVTRDEAGQIQGVRYDELAPMLLNELQEQDAKIRGLEQQVAK